jgi:hypothetical protein
MTTAAQLPSYAQTRQQLAANRKPMGRTAKAADSAARIVEIAGMAEPPEVVVLEAGETVSTS